MPQIDLETLLSPISEAAPAGGDLEYDPAFAEMEQAAAGKPEQQMGNSVVEAEEPDWRSVASHAIELLQRTKDLRVSIYLCLASLRTDGWQGFRDALELTDRLTREFWETLHPVLDEDDDRDPTARVNAILTLAHPPLLRAIETTPLLSVPVLGSVTWADIKPATSDEEPAASIAEVSAVAMQASPDTLASQRDLIHATLRACQSLETFVTQQVGAAQAPNLQPLRDLLKRIEQQFHRWLAEHPAAATETVDQVAPDADLVEDDQPDEDSEHGAMPFAPDQPETSRIATGPRRNRGPLTSRQEVLATIDSLLEFYRIHEPSSPVPLLLMRARRLAGMSFLEILQDMIPEGVNTAYAIGGVNAADFTPATDAPPPYPAKPGPAAVRQQPPPPTAVEESWSEENDDREASPDDDDDFFS